MTVHRIQKWNDFKNLVGNLKPDIIFFWKEMHPLRKPPIGLRFDFYHNRNFYIFIDFASGKKMWKTKIPVHSKNKDGHVDDKEIIYFIAPISFSTVFIFRLVLFPFFKSFFSFHLLFLAILH